MRGAGPGQLSLLELLPSAGRDYRVDVDVAAAALGEWDRQVLTFAVEHHLTGRYDQLVQQDLGCSATRYLQALVGILDRPEVLAAQPDLIGRLRALRDRPQRLRALSRGPQPDFAVPVSAPALGRSGPAAPSVWRVPP